MGEIARWKKALDSMPDDQVAALFGWFWRYYYTRVGVYVNGWHVAVRRVRP